MSRVHDYVVFPLIGLLLLLMPQSAASVEPPRATHLSSFSEGLYAPIRIATDREGNAYVTETRRHRISVLDAYGNPLKYIHGVQAPLGIAVDGQRRLYIGDRETGSVKILTSGGSALGTLGKGDGQFTMPTDIALDSQGSIYVVDSKENCVKVFDKDGTYRFQFGDTELTFPTGIAIDEANDAILVGQYGALENGGNGAKIQIFDRKGNWKDSIGRYGAEAGEFTRIQGLTVDGQGRIYVTDCFQSTVQVVDYTGKGLSFIGNYGTEPGQLRLPSDVAFDRCNRLWVTSSDNGRIEVFGIDAYGSPEDMPLRTDVAGAPVEEMVPTTSILLPSYPNPGNPEIWIPFRLSQDADVTVEIYNVGGQWVRTLPLGHKAAGIYTNPHRAAYWDGTTHTGEAVTSGVYFYTINAGTFRDTRRTVILK